MNNQQNMQTLVIALGVVAIMTAATTKSRFSAYANGGKVGHRGGCSEVPLGQLFSCLQYKQNSLGLGRQTGQL
jgi:hypothetical protein